MLPSLVSFTSAREPGLPPDLYLSGRLFLPPLPPPDLPAPARPLLPGLVVGHGAGSTAARHEEFCLEACRGGFVVLALDFRGHGGSDGVADGPLHLDLVAAARFLRDHPAVDKRLVCYRGSSMGGFYGLKAAADAAFAALALLCPASEETMLQAVADAESSSHPCGTGAPSPKRPLDTEAPESSATTRTPTSSLHARWDIPRMRAFFADADSRRLAAQVDCPVLLVHARGDKVVPLSHSLLLAGHLATETTFLALAGGSHTTAQHDPLVHSFTVRWLRDTISAVVRAGSCDHPWDPAA